MTSLPRRLLFLDIETKPAVVHAWKLRDQNIGVNQVLDPGGMICFAAQWDGSDEMLFHADWIDGHRGMVETAHVLLAEADKVVTYNGDKFDLPKLRGEFLLADLPPLPQTLSVDLLKTMKRFGLLSNKLAFVAPLLTGEEKAAHEGHGLWVKVMAGEADAQARMESYCRQDVQVLVSLYDRLRPHLSGERPRRRHVLPPPSCGACGCARTERRALERTAAGLVRLFQCPSCGRMQQGGLVEAG